MRESKRHIKQHVMVCLLKSTCLFFTARTKMLQQKKVFSSWCCFSVFLAFFSVITFFPSSFYTGFDLSWTRERLILVCYKGLTRHVTVYIWELNLKPKIKQNKIISYSSVIGPAHILHQEKKNYRLSHSLCVNQKWKLNNWAYHAKHS